jgi:hypothetical protein
MLAFIIFILFILMAALVYLAVYDWMWKDRAIDPAEAPLARESPGVGQRRLAPRLPTIAFRPPSLRGQN